MKKTLLKQFFLLFSICIPVFIHAQITQKVNWQNLDLQTDSVFGISTEKAYTELLTGKKHVPVLVAVIDGGVDINHEDLKSVIWTNPKEKSGNGIDDDKNGYADDIHGWDFIGGKNGDEQFDNLELTRLLRQQKGKYDHVDTTKLNTGELADYHSYLNMQKDFDEQVAVAQSTAKRIKKFMAVADTIAAGTGVPNPTAADIAKYTPKNAVEKQIAFLLSHNMGSSTYSDFKSKQLTDALEHYQQDLDYHLNMNYDPRSVVGDDYTNVNQHNYGNNDVTGPDAHHGTHVAGIIGAVRDNALGIKGVANDVVIMSVRTVPDGDERDKDVANAIRYAAKNGAKVINMSFGKTYSLNKTVVDEAVKYAISKDVLIIHAAGNDNTDLDNNVRYPNRKYADNSGIASSWIEVGASGPVNDETLKAPFSCYGKTSVDVFAPGVKIYSTTPGSQYAEYSGTSMASPVVAGLAALIRSYYPKLKANQVKEIILKSVVKVDHDVTLASKTESKVPFSDLCNTGGIVNAYNALKLAATY